MKKFETNVFEMTIHDNFIKEVKVKKNKTYSEKDVWESRDLSYGYDPKAKFFVLMEGEDNSSVSADARSAAASEEYAKTVSALALCSDNLVLAIMGNLFLKINKPKVPTKFFDNRAKAYDWLKIQASKSKP